MDLVETKDKLKNLFSWEKIAENLPMIAGLGVGLVVLDRLLSIGVNLEPLYKKVRQWNSDGVFEIIDSVGDNIQLVDLILKAFNVNVGEEGLKKLADFLQSLGTGGKHLSKLMGLVNLDKLLGAGGSGRGSKSRYNVIR
ncbi:hypothetical protein ES705_13676 [subsurface metagenome]